MTNIALENLQGWVSTEWDDAAAKQSANQTAENAKALGANQ